MNYLKHRNATLQGKVEHLEKMEKEKKDFSSNLQSTCGHNIVAEAPCCIEYSYQYPIRICLVCGLSIEKDYCGRYGEEDVLMDTDDRTVCTITRDALFELRHKY